MVFTPTQLHVLTSSKKAALLEPLKEAARKSAAGVELVLHPRAKGDDGAAGVDALLAAASAALSAVKPEPGMEAEKQQLPSLSVLAKEPPVGALGELWLSRLSASGAATCDAGPGLSRVLAAKDAAELAAVRGASLLAAACVTRSVAPTLEKVVDEEREVTHARLAARFDKALADPTKLFGGDAAAAAKALPDPSAVDAAFTPCVQSGGHYDLKLGAAPDESKLQPDVIVVSLGARASSYCAAVGRTYFVDPDATQEKEYKALCAAFDAAVGALRPGEPLSAARDAAVAALEASEAPHLAKMLPKVVGGGVGLEVRESALALSSSSTTKVEPGMCFVVRLGVTGLTRDDPPEGKAAAYALLVCDTVAVPLSSGSKEGGEEKEDKDGADAAASLPAEVLTASASRAWGDVAYELDGGSEDGEESEGLDDADGGAADGAEDGIAERKKALRAAAVDAAGADRDRAKRGQDALLERINQITLEALTSKGGAGGAGGKTGRKLSNVCAYKSPQDVPAPPAARVSVDARAESLLLPIYGATLPLHILTVKNAMHSQDGELSCFFFLSLFRVLFSRVFLEVERERERFFFRKQRKQRRKKTHPFFPPQPQPQVTTPTSASPSARAPASSPASATQPPRPSRRSPSAPPTRARPPRSSPRSSRCAPPSPRARRSAPSAPRSSPRRSSSAPPVAGPTRSRTCGSALSRPEGKAAACPARSRPTPTASATAALEEGRPST